jgi:hypothetical protein
MKIIVCTCFLVASLGWSSAAQESSPSDQPRTGTVRGTVVDGRNHPVEGAEVAAQSLAGSGGIRPTAVTGKQGQFEIADIPVGTFLIIASKVSDYYPDATFAFFASDTAGFPKVQVIAGKTLTDVVVRLGPKGGRLQGKILDAETRQPVLTSRIRLTRQDDSALYVSTSPDESGEFDFVVPSRPITMEVVANGYQAWSSSAESGPNGAILVAPATTKQMDVLLKPLSSEPKR